MENSSIFESTLFENPNKPDRKSVGGYIIKECLGSGGFANVHVAEKEGKIYAIKIYNLQKMSEKEKEEKLRPGKLSEMVDTEIKALSSLKHHRTIMKIYDYFRTEKNLYLVLQYIEEGDLVSWISKNGWLTDQQVLEFLPSLFDAFKKTQALKIMHRDIKPENLFLSGSQIIIGDFGAAKVGSDSASTTIGTNPFFSPELVNYQEYDFSSDVWALGVTLYMCMFGRDPWNIFCYEKKQSKSKLQIVLNKNSKERKLKNDMTCGHNLYFPPDCNISLCLRNILCKMLQRDPQKRGGWSELADTLEKELTMSTILTVGTPKKVQIEVESLIFQPIMKQDKEQIVEIDPQHNKSSTYGEFEEEVIHSRIIFQVDQRVEVQNEAMKRYLDYYSELTKQNKRVVEGLLYEIQKDTQWQEFKGPINMAANIVAKKSRTIAKYFVDVLKSQKYEHPRIGKCTDFYQNGFAKPYLDNFAKIKDQAKDIIMLTAQEAKEYLTQNYHRSGEQLIWADQVEKFDQVVNNGLEYAAFMICKGIDSTNPSSFHSMKQLISLLSVICRYCTYEDCTTLDHETFKYDALKKELKDIEDSSKLDNFFKQSKEFFKMQKEDGN